MTIDEQLERKLETVWPDVTKRQRARAELQRYGVEAYEREPVRVRLALVKLCEGDLERLVGLVGAAKRDYRDVLMWAEYPSEGSAWWAASSKLSEEEQHRLEALRRSDREQYQKWLKE